MSLSYFFWNFIAWIAEQSEKQEIRTLYFFTREGEFFKKLYDVWRRQSSFGKSMPQAKVAEVSRMSVYLPSMQKITIEELNRIWIRYPIQSMETLCRTLSVDINQIKGILKTYGIREKEYIRQPWKDSRIRSLFQDKAFVAWLEKQRDDSRTLLYAYLEQIGWSRSAKNKIGIVDIGWRGSIQDSLCRLYPERKIIGFYIGLQPFLVKQPANAVKYGYINGYKNKDAMLLTVRPLEMLCNSRYGSVQGYRLQSGRVVAIRKTDVCENKVYESYSCKMQKKIWADRYTFLRLMKHCGRRSDKNRAARSLYRFLAYPDRRSTAAYFTLRHNEEFGMGKYIDLRADFRPDLFGMAVFCKKGRKKLKEMLRQTAWPQGYLVRFWMYPLLIPYNCLLRSYLKKKQSRQEPSSLV